VRALPVAVLRDPRLSIEVNYRREPAPFALRNVFADEFHVILGGAATVETQTTTSASCTWPGRASGARWTSLA
jgi:hypothetical protein